MKVLYLLILLNSVSLFAQQDSSDWGRDILLEQYKWDVEKKERGTMMFLDLRFEYKNKDEFLTLTIAKNYKKDVPEFISVILPDRVDTVNGLYLGFVSTVKDTSKVGWTLKPDTAASILCRYDKHRDDYYTTRFVDGIATTKDGREKNCFQSFMTHNHVVIMFWLGPEREKKSIMLPLLSFKQQYGELE